MKTAFIFLLVVFALCITDNTVDAVCPFSSSRCVLHCRDNGFSGGKCGGFLRYKCKCNK
uniref:Defensin n=1 Tax=Hadrurus spadix TaxID=141984 RepID=A0A1W7RAM8_9SCOR